MRYIRFALLALLGLPLLAACGAGAANAGSGSNPNVIGNWELQNLTNLNALEAIERLRPRWLNTRSSGGPISSEAGGMYEVRLHIDGSPQSDLGVLETISAEDIREMRFIRGTEASTRYGTGYTNGVILVTTEG